MKVTVSWGGFPIRPTRQSEFANYLIDRAIAKRRTRVNEAYREDARQAAAWLNERLVPHLESSRVRQTGFYLYLTFAAIETR